MDLSECTDLRNMFSGCSKVTNFNFVKNWNISKCELFMEMFRGCNFENLDFLSKWNVIKAENISNMLMGCKKLNNIKGVKNWNVKNVKTFIGHFHLVKI